MLREAGAAVLLKMSSGGDGSRLKAGMTGKASLIRRLNPFRRTPPEGVAMLGAKETEMTDFGGAGVGGRDGQDLRLDRGKSGTQQSDRRPGRPGIVGQAQRAHRTPVIRKIGQAGKFGIRS